jgi:ubiquitin carboxyl-terminal hydrolase 36/42
MWLGSKKLLVPSLKPGKKTKHKRTRRRAVVCKDMASLGDNMNEQLTSTSSTAQSETVERTSNHRKRSHASARPEDDTQSSKNKQKVDGACVGTGTSAPCANADIPKSSPSTSVTESRKNVDAKLGAPQPVSIRASDLMEAAG